MPSNKRHLTTDLLSVLEGAIPVPAPEGQGSVPSQKKATSRGVHHVSRKSRVRHSRHPQLPHLPPEVLSIILHHPLLPPCCKGLARLVNHDWRSAFDQMVFRLVCHTTPTHLPSRFPCLRHLDLCLIPPGEPKRPPLADVVLGEMAPALPFLERLVLSYGQVLGDVHAIHGVDRMELVQVGYRSYPAKAADRLAHLLLPLTQLRNFLIVNIERGGMPCTLAVYRRYHQPSAPPAAACTNPRTAPRASRDPPSAPRSTDGIGGNGDVSTGTCTGTSPGAGHACSGSDMVGHGPSTSTATTSVDLPTSSSGAAAAGFFTSLTCTLGTTGGLSTTPEGTSTGAPEAANPPMADGPAPQAALPDPSSSASPARVGGRTRGSQRGQRGPGAGREGGSAVDGGMTSGVQGTCEVLEALSSPVLSRHVKWLSHVDLLLPPFFGPYLITSLHIHNQEHCLLCASAPVLEYPSIEELLALPKSAWSASKSWCSLRALDLNNPFLPSWPSEWLHLPLLRYLNVNPYNTAPDEPIPGFQVPSSLQLHLLTLSGLATSQLLPSLPLGNQLQALTIYNSDLSELPSTLAPLTSLTSLWLAGNRLDSDSLAPLLPSLSSSLLDLDLSLNLFTALPDSLSQLTRLTKLKMGGCRIILLEESVLAPLTNLQVLDLCECRLHIFPFFLTRLSSLHTLSLQNTTLIELPPCISALSALQSLDLFGNDLSTLPPTIGSLTALTALDLANNFLDSLPPELWQLRRMKVLFLAHNTLSLLPPEVSQLCDLIHLDLSFNPMAGIPDSLSSLQHLESLGAQGLLAPPPFHLAESPSLLFIDLTADGLDIRWLDTIPPSQFQAQVADPLLNLTNKPRRARVFVDKNFVVRLRQAWCKAVAQPSFPKLSSIQWDASVDSKDRW